MQDVDPIGHLNGVNGAIRVTAVIVDQFIDSSSKSLPGLGRWWCCPKLDHEQRDTEILLNGQRKLLEVPLGRPFPDQRTPLCWLVRHARAPNALYPNGYRNSIARD